MADNVEQADLESNSKPFHEGYDDPDAELILESSDGVRFAIHPIILRLASDVFAGMLSIPQPPPHDLSAVEMEEDESRHIVPLDEDSDALAQVLDIITPGRDGPRLEDLKFREVRQLASIADKYHLTDVTRSIRRSLYSSDSRLVPLRKYMLARIHNWTTEADAFACGAQTYFEAKMVPLYMKDGSLDASGALHLLLLRSRRQEALKAALRVGNETKYSSTTFRASSIVCRDIDCDMHDADHINGCDDWGIFRNGVLVTFDEDEDFASSEMAWPYHSAVVIFRGKLCGHCSLRGVQMPLLDINRLRVELQRVIRNVLPRALE